MNLDFLTNDFLINDNQFNDPYYCLLVQVGV